MTVRPTKRQGTDDPGPHTELRAEPKADQEPATDQNRLCQHHLQERRPQAAGKSRLESRQARHEALGAEPGNPIFLYLPHDLF